MKNYKKASDTAQEFIFNYLKERMKEKKITQNKLAEKLNLSVTTLVRYFKKETPITLDIYLQICGILELRPYIIPKEMDKIEMQRFFFN